MGSNQSHVPEGGANPNSGWNHLSGKWPRIRTGSSAEGRAFALSLRATAATYERYRGVPEMPVWEAVALHLRLDPAFLNLKPRWPARMQYLGQMSRLWRGRSDLGFPRNNPLGQFLLELSNIPTHMDVGALPVVYRDRDEVIHSIVETDVFDDFLWNHRTSEPHFQDLQPSLPRRLDAYRSDFSPLTRLLLDAAVHGFELERTGVYPKDDHRIVDEVASLLTDQASARGFTEKEFSGICKRVMLKIIRPVGVPLGRRRRIPDNP